MLQYESSLVRKPIEDVFAEGHLKALYQDKSFGCAIMITGAENVKSNKTEPDNRFNIMSHVNDIPVSLAQRMHYHLIVVMLPEKIDDLQVQNFSII